MISNPFGGGVFSFKRVDSTMKTLREYPADGKVVVTLEQQAGRGRIAGRRWISPPGESLLFSLSLLKTRIRVPQTSIPVRTAMAIADLLRDEFGVVPEIKWPNDILVNGKKISGILGESSGAFLYIGIGLNCTQHSFDSSLRRPATSIFLETGKTPKPLELLEPLLNRMAPLFFKVNEGDFSRYVRGYLHKIGEYFEVSEGPADEARGVSGIVEGLGPAGELLLLQKNGKIRSIYSGE